METSLRLRNDWSGRFVLQILDDADFRDVRATDSEAIVVAMIRLACIDVHEVMKLVNDPLLNKANMQLRIRELLQEGIRLSEPFDALFKALSAIGLIESVTIRDEHEPPVCILNYLLGDQRYLLTVQRLESPKGAQ